MSKVMSKVEVYNNKENLLDIFNFVNRHLIVAERCYEEPFKKYNSDCRRVVIPQPKEKSAEEYLSRFIDGSQLVRVGPRQVSELNGIGCLICLDNLECDQVMRILKCGHLFHKSCIDKWLNQDRDTLSCPVCRRSQYEEKLY